MGPAALFLEAAACPCIMPTCNEIWRWQAGALLYFPIHYAGITVFESPRVADMELLTTDYNRSLDCRGQVLRLHRVGSAKPFELGPVNNMHSQKMLVR